MAQVISAIEQVTAAWLSDVFKQAISDVQVEPVTGGYEGKFRIRANCDDGSSKHLFLKFAPYTREARFYLAMRDNPAGVPIVPCYDAGIEGENAHILLQDLSQTHEARPPSQFPPNGRECEAIIDGLADLHAYWWNSPKLETTFGGALAGAALRQNYDEDIAIFPAFADFLGDRLAPHYRSIYERVGSQLTDLMVQRFTQGDLTLVFEDVHSGNFLYPRQPDDKLYFIDWEQWGINLAMNDLAYMMALFWSAERRSRLETAYLKRYHERITAQGIRYSWDALWYDYRLCVMCFLYRPVLQWSRHHPIDVWWNHFERITVAYLDLNCDALLG